MILPARRLRISGLVVSLLVTGLLLLPGEGSSAFPGGNGRIVVATGGIAWPDGNPGIYSMNPDGSDAGNLTQDAASDAVPRWSPDGQTIGFLSDRNSRPLGLYLMNADGSNPRLVQDGVSSGLSWSPDGTQLLFGVCGGAQAGIHAIGSDGSAEQRLTDACDSSPAWSPDGTQIAFNRGADIWAIEPDGSGLHVLVTDGSNPDWSPNGTQIVFQRSISNPDGTVSTHVFGANSDGGGQQELTTGQLDSNPAWSPDGTAIAFDRQGLWAMNADGSNQHFVGCRGGAGGPNWQPSQAMPPLSSRPYFDSILSDGPAAYWRLGEVERIPAADATGHGHDGTYIPGYNRYQEGDYLFLGSCGAIANDGDPAVGFEWHAHVDVPFSSDVNPAGPLSVETWVTGDAPLNGFGAIVSSRNADYSQTPAPTYGYVLYLAASQGGVRPEFWLGRGAAGGWSQLQGSLIAGANWTHVVATWDGTQMRLYINGRLDTSRSAPPSPPNTSKPLWIGTGRNESVPTFPLFGLVDEVAVYDSALSADRIGVHYRLGKGLDSYAPAGDPSYDVLPTTVGRAATGSTMFATHGHWNGTDPIDYAYQWLRCDGDGVNCATLDGATGGPLAIRSYLLGSTLRVRVTASNAVGSASATSDPTPRVADSYQAKVLARNPVAYWPLKELHGPSASDVSGGGHSGSYVNPRLGFTGHCGPPRSAPRFDGSSSYVEVPYSTVLNGTQFSVESWVMPTGGSGYRSIVTSRASDPGIKRGIPRGYTLDLTPDGSLRFILGDGNSLQYLYGSDLPLGTWTHVVATYDGGDMRIFVNTIQVASRPASFVPNGSRPLRIGAGNTENLPAYFFTGQIEEIAVYDSSLTPIPGTVVLPIDLSVC
jgi:hypothetical protein